MWKHVERSSQFLMKPTRRGFLQQAGGGLGALALQWLLNEEHARASTGPLSPLAPQSPHFRARARSVIYLFMHGGPSHLETFDPKPDLQRLAGQPLPASFGPVATRRKVAYNPLLATRRSFRKCGQSGIEISDFLPHLTECADDLAVIRSCWADSVNHPQAVYEINTGSILMGKPSLGSWVSYGLGTENQDLPAFLVLPDPAGGIKGGPPAYGAGFLPASHQGTLIRSGDRPILDLRAPEGISSGAQRGVLDLIGRLNRHHLEDRGPDAELEARIQTYELAFRMQSAAPEAVDLTNESAETKRLYGLDHARTAEFGTRCLLARRLVERGVRFIQLYSGDVNGWDAHDNVESNHATMCGRADKPVAGLLMDLRNPGKRNAREHARDLGGRVWTNAYVRKRQRARSQPPRVLLLAGRRRRQGRHRARRNRRGRAARGGRSRARSRPPRHDSAPARARPQAAHLPSQWPGRSPDRHGRRGHPFDSDIIYMFKSLIWSLSVFWALSGIASIAADPDHWAFIPPERHEVPGVKEARWVRNPIDAFILARLEQRGVPHSPLADRPTLLRRLTFDLTGMPPTPGGARRVRRRRIADLRYERHGRSVCSRVRAMANDGGQHWARPGRGLPRPTGFREFDQARPDAWALS